MYRDNCERCKDLQEELDLMKNKELKQSLPEFQDWRTAKCPSCQERLFYNNGRRYGNSDYNGVKMDKFCDGYVKFFGFKFRKSSCPITPHVHRKCKECMCEWFESTSKVVTLFIAE